MAPSSQSVEPPQNPGRFRAEFQAAADKFESWIKGNLGKLAAFIALAVGAVVAAVKKDWSWFFGAVVLAIGMGILIGIVNASFTSTI